jgi:hypothetical protein
MRLSHRSGELSIPACRVGAALPCGSIAPNGLFPSGAFACELLAHGWSDLLRHGPDWCFVVADQVERADPIFECEPDEFIDGLRPDVQESAKVDRGAAGGCGGLIGMMQRPAAT